MGVRQSMDLLLVKKKKKIWEREIMGVSTKYGFGIYREIIKWGKKMMGVWQRMSLDSMKKKKESEQKNHGVWKKYGFE